MRWDATGPRKPGPRGPHHTQLTCAGRQPRPRVRAPSCSLAPLHRWPLAGDERPPLPPSRCRLSTAAPPSPRQRRAGHKMRGQKGARAKRAHGPKGGTGQKGARATQSTRAGEHGQGSGGQGPAPRPEDKRARVQADRRKSELPRQSELPRPLWSTPPSRAPACRRCSSLRTWRLLRTSKRPQELDATSAAAGAPPEASVRAVDRLSPLEPS